MPDRREFIIGGAALGTFGVAEFLRPREAVRLFSGITLEEAVPKQFGKWREHPGGSVIAPVTPDSLADRLYSATLSRVYYLPNEEVPPIMLLIAYGGVQSDLLQLHRPEACYPAVGMAIGQREMGAVPVSRGHEIPAVYLSAVGDDRVEDIVYWTRLGEDFPRTASEQRSDRLSAAMAGTIGDGMLVRASTIRITERPAWPYVAGFLSDVVNALPQKARKGFIGTELASTV
ncbi:exosortase-associated protein EpsI, V-type [Qipengyuania sp.]|uniref:exosortase-associated protein EpsI, V-type n=1 Tax=Qipengyuania sp. TaxID=2004515 RepID=UPI0035C81BF8